jgi:hypothetical protein
MPKFTEEHIEGILAGSKMYIIPGHEDAGRLYHFRRTADPDSPDLDGALVTEDNIRAFVPGYAHVTSEGIVWRDNKIIADFADLVEVAKPIVEN